MTRESFCANADGSRKVTYLSKPEAKKVARFLAKREDHMQQGAVFHLYRCPDCHCYHLGHDVDGGHAA